MFEVQDALLPQDGSMQAMPGRHEKLAQDEKVAQQITRALACGLDVSFSNNKCAGGILEVRVKDYRDFDTFSTTLALNFEDLFEVFPTPSEGLAYAVKTVVDGMLESRGKNEEASL